MTQREKVIKGLMCIAGDVVFCEHCKYSNVNGFGRGDRCKCDCAKDAIALLKSQESQATTHEAEWHIFKGRRGATCSYCKYTFDDVYDPENYDCYCRHCGARMVKIRTVKWE